MESHIRQERNKLFNEIYSLKLAKDQEISELKQNNVSLFNGNSNLIFTKLYVNVKLYL